MPRVANPPVGKGRMATQQTIATPHKASPVKLFLNDDRSEKAARLQSRQALHDIQMNQIKAAASPMRKMNEYENNRAGSSSPRTPRSATAVARDRDRGKENTDPTGSSPRPLNAVSNSAVTPMKRVPILANFEEWMKMATDNKINATNSWNFALIDYFHDLSLLKEGDGVNFQKASCTLDGCVKIYTSRVDSVASETGKLLSGLADSGNGKKGRGDREEGEGESGDEEEGEDGARKKAKKKTQRSHEQTLAPSFASLQLKKLELEFAVDPLFKKASADFDEGGAKGLLLNHLSIDSEGRIVFDSSDDTADAKSYPNASQMQQTLVDPTAAVTTDISNLSVVPESEPSNQEIDLTPLASKFFPDLSILDSQDICPSMKSFTLGDPTSDLNMPFLKAPDDWRENNKPNDNTEYPSIPTLDRPIGDRSGIFLDSENAAGFDDDDDGPLGGFDIGPDVGFGEGGEAWAKDAALEPMLRVAQADDNGSGEGTDGIIVGDFDPAHPNADAYTVGLNHQHRIGDHTNDPTDNILTYFDTALKSSKAASLAGPEHWRIRKIKAAAAQQNASDHPPPMRTRKEKEPFVIDFLGPMDQTLADMLYTPAASNSAISLPKAQWRTKGRNLLPDDRHFSSKSLLGLWTKPKARVGRRKVVPGMPSRGVSGSGQEEGDGRVEMDEAYWARRKEEDERQKRADEEEEKDRKEGDYDANFFADDDGALPFGGGLPDDVDDDDDGCVGFTDAREMLSPPPTATTLDPSHPATFDGLPSSSQQPPIDSQPSNLLPGSFGAQLVTQAGRRLRPEYVNYARVAKKVDVRRLKENMWRGMSQKLRSSLPPPSSSSATAFEHDNIDEMGPPTPAPTDPGKDADGDVDMDMDMMDIDPPPQALASKDGAAVPAGPELRFTSMIRDLAHVYPEQQMRDISTSYCFICLLHLANEKGLVLESGDGARDGGGEGGGEGIGVGQEAKMEEIRVRRDESVGVGYVGE